MQILDRFHINRNLKLLHFADIIINHMNIRRNDVVLVHTSLHNLKHSDFQPEDLIYLLKMIIGTEGTLLMPVFGKSNLAQFSSQSQNEKCNSLPGNDLITDVFQHMEDTITGNYPGYTLAAWGKHANFMTETNNNTESSLDIVSLGYKLNQLKAKFIGFGVPFTEFSFLNFSNHAGGKSSSSKDSDQVNNESFEFFTEHFEENEIRTFTKRGISYFWVNCVKA
jgi:aminoglycoside 3-N-acetyltransferase